MFQTKTAVGRKWQQHDGVFLKVVYLFFFLISMLSELDGRLFFFFFFFLAFFSFFFLVPDCLLKLYTRRLFQRKGREGRGNKVSRGKRLGVEKQSGQLQYRNVTF
ncbi:hypothetical protein QBC42DRAFT_16033 [Cladorrhinum samala]|uniref:Uncharacterized protein n=1 Tax=Cladorrhinum samala TaxID=585594 RepID=A0AAV9HG28_9PEZI|nr:hypothetical protein QBC42DRAFT_16033 [Cladorrhinum samala]